MLIVTLKKILEPQLLSYLRRLPNPTFQGSARSQVAQVILNIFETIQVTNLQCLSTLPVLSLIEHVLDIIGRRLTIHSPQNLETLGKFDWDKIPQENINHLTDSCLGDSIRV